MMDGNFIGIFSILICHKKLRKMKKIKIIAVLLLIPSLSAAQFWGTDYISQVKEGVFNDYKQSTVGVAFDRWKQCDKGTNWTAFETPNGRNIVQYKCLTWEAKKEHALALRDSVFDKYPTREEGLKAEPRMCEWERIQQIECNFTWVKYFSVLQIPIHIVFQFTVNVDDSFEISYIGAVLSYMDRKDQLHEIEMDISSLGDVNDFLDIIMGDDTFNLRTIEEIHTYIAKRVGDSVVEIFD